MKLNALRLHIVKLPLVRPFASAHHTLTERHFLLLEAEVDGVTAWGECAAFETPFYTAETIQTARHILRDFLYPVVRGRPLGHPAEVQTYVQGVRGHPMATAALEMVLWDAWGRLEGRSLADLLSAPRSQVPVGVAIGRQPSMDVLLERVADYVQQGYRRVKLKIKPGDDLLPVQTVRRAFPDLPLQVDANAAYQRSDAQYLLKLDDYGLLLIEQPLPAEDLPGHARLQARLRTPLCLDESVASPLQARVALEMQACRTLNIKPARVGGLSQAIAIHTLCLEQGIAVWCGGMLESGLGRALNLALAALPGFTLPGDISATARYYHQDIILEPFVLTPQGTLAVPDAPGLGVTVDRAALRRFCVFSETVQD